MTPADTFQPILDAYSLAGGVDPGTLAPVDDLLDGQDADGVRRPIGVVRGGVLGLRGTIMPSGCPLIEWLRDFDIVPEPTEFGTVARGAWWGYQGLSTRSGRPLASLGIRAVGGHSYGAGLAAIVAVALGVTPCLWAVPNWWFAEFRSRFAALRGWVFAEAGDVVPWLGYLLEPKLQPVTHLVPGGQGDLVYHHEFSTYMASYLASLPSVTVTP